MKRTPLSRKPKPDPEHAAATKLARESACLICGKVGLCVPAHWPTHRGMGGRRGFWRCRCWVPLCPTCHDTTDARNGASESAHEATLLAWGILAVKAPSWWAEQEGRCS